MEKGKILIASDSHGRQDLFLEAVKRQQSVDAVIFLGDGLADCEEVALSDYGKNKSWLTVRGNCDVGRKFLGADVSKLGCVTLFGKRIVFTHGDLYGVKYHNEGLRKLAKETGADIVLYGHTHRACEEYSDGVYYVNPGSIYGGEGGRSCALLSVVGDDVLFSFMTLD